MESKNENLFRSSFFRKLFFSYVLLILLSLVIFFAWYLYSYNVSRHAAIRENAATVQSFRSHDPLTDDYDGTASGFLPGHGKE